MNPTESSPPRAKPDYSKLEYIPAFVPEPAAGPVEPAATSVHPARKIDWNATPLIELVDAAAQQRTERETEERRRAEALGLVRLLGWALAGLVAFVLLIEAVQFFANDRPPADQLQAEADRVGAEVLRLVTVPGQPLALAEARAEFFGTPARGRADYDLVVTIELRAPLYAPADSNGVQPYLQLQRSLRDAHTRMLERGLFLRHAELSHPPVLPPVIALTHRAGDRIVCKVPLEAARGAWSWRLVSRLERRRDGGRRFAGEELERQPATRLIFGAPGTREEMRRLMGEARAYILAVNAALAELP